MPVVFSISSPLEIHRHPAGRWQKHPHVAAELLPQQSTASMDPTSAVVTANSSRNHSVYLGYLKEIGALFQLLDWCLIPITPVNDI